MPIQGHSASDPFAQKLRQSDKLEDKIASFMVDSLLASDKDLGSKLGELKQLSTSMATSSARRGPSASPSSSSS